MCTNIWQVLQTTHAEGNAFLLHVSYMPAIKGASASVTSSNSEFFSNRKTLVKVATRVGDKTFKGYVSE